MYLQHNAKTKWNYKGVVFDNRCSVAYRSDIPDCPPEVSKKEIVVTGKRWEAIREGVEDYAYLYLLKQAINKASPQAAAKAKKLLAYWCEKVLKNDNNHLLADKAKKQIMEEIVKISRK